MRIKVVIPSHPGDVDLAYNLLDWIEDLGGLKEYELVWINPYPSSMISKTYKLFKLAQWVVPRKASINLGWPAGANIMFETALENVKEPFLWLEPDAVPLCEGWMDYLNEEYNRVKIPFMGSINSGNKVRHLSGVAIYPENAKEWYKGLLPSTKPFDMVDQSEILLNTHHTQLIQNFWGKHGLPPIFKENIEKTDKENTVSPRMINKKAVLFHRSKDGKLVQILRERMKATK
jgi:hypothetical protein